MITRFDSIIDFNWTNIAPDPLLPVDSFSVVWTGAVRVNSSAQYTFCTESDDGVRLWVDNQLLVDNWTNHTSTQNCVTIFLDGGARNFFSIHLEYYEGSGDALIRLLWKESSNLGSPQPISRNFLYPSTTQAVVWGSFPIINPGAVPFTALRLREYAINQPQLFWPNGNQPSYPSITWNQRVGRYFQGRVLDLINLNENGGNIPSLRREAAGGRPNVRPDARGDVTVRVRDASGTFFDETYPLSNLLEVKARSGNISRSYENYQILGILDAARSAETLLGARYNIEAVTLITTADTFISLDLITTATDYRTIFCDALVWELPGSNPPFTSQLIIAPAALLNPEVEFAIFPVENPSCPAFPFTSGPLIDGDDPLPEIPGDPDPIVLDIDPS